MSKILILLCVVAFLSNAPLLNAENDKPKVVSPKKKRELEKRFAKLKNFYIADDGTVVIYKIKEDTNSNDKGESAQAPNVKKQTSTNEAATE